MSFRPRRSLHWLKIVFANLGRSRTFGIAAEMAFWLFLSLLPLAAVAGLMAAKLAMSNAGAASGVLSSLPPAVRELLAQELTKVSAWNEGAVGPVAALTFVWLASSGIHAVFDGLELETEATARPWWKKRVLSIGACVLLSLGVAAIGVLAVGVGWIRRFAAHTVPILDLSTSVSTVLRTGLSAVIAVLLVAGIYALGLPSRARKRMPLWPGAVVAVLLQTALGFAYGFYVRRAGDGGAYQGALAVIGITLIALYLVCIAILVGVEVNQIIGTRRLLAASVHPAMAPPPALTDAMICCDDKSRMREEPALRASLAAGE